MLTKVFGMETEVDEFGNPQDLIDEGGVEFALSGVIEMLRQFDLGPVLVTAGVVSALGLGGRGPEPVARALASRLIRHAQGDFGRFGGAGAIKVTEEQMRKGCFATSDTATLNVVAMRGGTYTNVHSSYADVPGIAELWVMTDRRGPSTTVLLPSEY